jgi:hypothetical protein
LPHVVLDGAVDLERYAREFRPLLVRRGRDTLRVDGVYVEREGRALLLESIVVEAGRKLPFYILVSGHDRGGATVRIDPLTHPERTDGVRELVARVGADLLAESPGATLRVTNLVLPSPPRDESSPSAGPPRSRDQEGQ